MRIYYASMCDELPVGEPSAVLLVAEILDRQGYDAWAWEDQALLRAADFLHEIDLAYGGWWAEGDDTGSRG